MSLRLLAVAGEASGDLHAARLLSELAELQAAAPTSAGLEVFGLGGEEMRRAGVATLADSSEISVVGLTEVAKILPRARQIFHALLAEVDRRRPAAALLVDFPDFNLRLARALKRRGIPVVYYISPQVWAWRRGRVRAIARDVERMLVLFPFEAEFYARHGVSAVHVGHPLVDEVPRLPQAWDRPVEGPFRVALLPGSRRSEVRALLPVQLGAFARLARELPVVGRIIQAPTIPRELLETEVARSGCAIEIVAEKRFEAVADSHLAFCASGTATLEVGLLGTPMILCYRLNPWTYRLARFLVRLPDVGLVNLVLGKRVVPEMIQDRALPEPLAAEAKSLLSDPAAIATMRAELGVLRERLGEPGASRRAARQLLDVLGRSPRP